MLHKRILVLLAALLFSLTTPLFLPPPPAHAQTIPGFSLFSSLEWKAKWGVEKTSSSDFAIEIQKRLNSKRKEIGKLALLIVHPNGSYDATDPVFSATRDGGGSLFEMTVRWHRDLGPVKRNHVTRIDWEILNNQHLQAAVVDDDSTFSAIHPQELSDLFQELLPSET